MKVQTPMLKICAIVDTKKYSWASAYMGGIPNTENNLPPPHKHT